MTADELRKLFNDTFKLDEWPKEYEVDAETYANVCQAFFEWAFQHEPDWFAENGSSIVRTALGPNQGIMFRNVELILKGRRK